MTNKISRKVIGLVLQLSAPFIGYLIKVLLNPYSPASVIFDGSPVPFVAFAGLFYIGAFFYPSLLTIIVSGLMTVGLSLITIGLIGFAGMGDSQTAVLAIAGFALAPVVTGVLTFWLVKARKHVISPVVPVESSQLPT